MVNIAPGEVVVMGLYLLRRESIVGLSNCMIAGIFPNSKGPLQAPGRLGIRVRVRLGVPRVSIQEARASAEFIMRYGELTRHRIVRELQESFFVFYPEMLHHLEQVAALDARIAAAIDDAFS